MGDTLTLSSTILADQAGVIAADSAGFTSMKSYANLLTSIAAMPLAGGTLTGNLLFTDNTYTIGAAGATRPSAVHVGTGGVVTAGDVTCGVVYAVNGASQTTLQHTGTLGLLNVTAGLLRIQTSQATFGFEFRPKSGYIEQYTPGANGNYTIWNSTQSMYLGLTTNGTNGIVSTTSGALVLSGATSVSSTVPISSGVYTFATVPTASSYSGAAIRISDRSQKWAYSDGTDWRFFVDGAVIS